jgi:abortive infection bacteriophage resistance protein
VKFDKPPETFDQQMDRLLRRGMAIADRSEALHYLSHLNYYRLAAYWLPFEADHATHRFRPGTGFGMVLDLYLFDRELRLLVMDAIERIEVSVRTQFAYHLSHRYGPHPHLDPSVFYDLGRYWDTRAKLETEVRRSREDFIRHLSAKYDEPLPPIWAVVELMSLGQLSKWYGNLKQRRDRKVIAEHYDLDEKYLRSFLHHLSIVRNLCAHHSRLWNREFTFALKRPGQRPLPAVQSLNWQDERKLYNTLVMLAYLMDVICPGHHWKHRLKVLIDSQSIDTRHMGFPDDFAERPVWAPAWKAA